MVDNLEEVAFDIPDGLLDEIQQNIQNIIRDFDVPEENKNEVIKQINYIYTRTKYLSITDELTGLSNRRCFDTTFEKEFLRASRYSNKLTLVMFDIDHFKSVNDTYGHQCGDFILKQVANAALQTFRKTDTVFRYGGEEFAVILTETDINQSIIPLERFRKTVQTLGLNYQGQEVNITVSIGACQLTSEMATKEEFLQKTDEALYEAKNSGRNKTVLSNFQ
ncbi:GGDEF domain-containing protein [bacterium]|nr:GGDEF domain-containing protein [bacterium]MBO5445953.1 GGDEF domain-containing protein [bacterium]